MNPLLREAELIETRRHFFGRAATGIGTAALASLANPELFADQPQTQLGAMGATHFAPKAKRVIYLFMSGAPSQLDMWDYKPKMLDWYDKDLPESVRNGQRITTMTSGQKRFPIAPSRFKFNQHGDHGAWVSEILPHTASVIDDLAVIKTVNTEAINHDPAITYIQTGSQLPGRPSTGAWLSYGLGSMNENLPSFVVLHSTVNGGFGGQALYARLWGSGFLSTRHQGVSLRSNGDPVLYLSNPKGISGKMRRKMLDNLAVLNQQRFDEIGDPEIQSRIAQYEMAYRMQTSVPELTDISDESRETLDLYGSDVTKPGTFAFNCLLARRLAERDVRFTQVFIRQWDQHGNLPNDIRRQCGIIDQPCAALIKDLKRRGMLEDTLVIWGGEFGRTIYCQGGLTMTNYGRDHHPRCYTKWMAGGGIKGGIVYGETDDFSYNVQENPAHIHDLNATILHTLGVDHERLTYRHQGRDFRLTDVHGNVLTDLLA
ncbi:MAG: sulfatase [Planctomycetaceae bacterium]|nr:sulfatase [Planctomycetaceae bacterium]|tara:strand:+ start:25146 stop:26603 length:1458 start_codon:yes stop_codon:yes gene_type:complete